MEKQELRRKNKFRGLVAALMLLASHVCTAQTAADYFITEWDTNLGPNPTQIVFYGVGLGYTILVEGIGNAPYTRTLTGNNQTVVKLPQPGKYRIKAAAGSGSLVGYRNPDSYQPAETYETGKLTKITQWGTTAWQADSRAAFFNALNMDITAIDIPDFSRVTNMYMMFAADTSLVANASVNAWNVGKVTDMSYLFSDNYHFNQPLDKWDVRQVQKMDGLFQNARQFDQPLTSWDAASIRSMAGMFSGARAFNQPLDNWVINNVTDMHSLFYQAAAFNQPLNNWNVSNVTNMDGAFQEAVSFNQPLPDWNVGKVTSMYAMFANSTAFNQFLGMWDVARVTDMTAMFSRSGMDCSHYTQTLNAWADHASTAPQVDFTNQNDMVYNDIRGRQYLSASKGWTFSGDNYDAACGRSDPPHISGGHIVARQIGVTWETTGETNVDHFDVEASSDGITYTGIGSVASQAPGGNSIQTLRYSFTVSVDTVLSQIGAFLLFGLTFLPKGGRHGRRAYRFLLLAGVALLTLVCCKKHHSEPDLLDKQLYIRIAQVNKDGSVSYSEALLASKE